MYYIYIYIYIYVISLVSMLYRILVFFITPYVTPGPPEEEGAAPLPSESPGDAAAAAGRPGELD